MWILAWVAAPKRASPENRKECFMPVFMPDHLVFSGQFELNHPLEPKQVAYLDRFHAIRHMIWDVGNIQSLLDPLREAVGLPVGVQGMYFVASSMDHEKVEQHPYVIDSSPLTRYYIEAGLSRDDDRSRPVLLVPGYWCHWVPDAEGKALIWDGDEEFYAFVDWLSFLIEHFLEPWGYSLAGTVTYRDNEDGCDNVAGTIVVSNSKISWEEHGRS